MYGGIINDVLVGGIGDDSLYGQNNSDQLNGNKGDDLLDGGQGKDTLKGGQGDDTLPGGMGADKFVFNETGAAQADVITDFDAGADRIRFFANTDSATATFVDQGGDLLITLGTNSVLIENTDQSDLNATNFLFV